MEIFEKAVINPQPVNLERLQLLEQLDRAKTPRQIRKALKALVKYDLRFEKKGGNYYGDI